MPTGGQISGFKQNDVSMLWSQIANRTVVNTTQENSIITTGVGSLVIPANTLIIGTTIKTRIFGTIQAGISGNITVNLKLNGTTYVQTVNNIPTIGAPVGCSFETLITLRSIGQAGSAIGNSSVQIASSGGGISYGSNVQSPSAIDTTVAQTIDCTVQWQGADPGNSLVITNILVERVM